MVLNMMENGKMVKKKEKVIEQIATNKTNDKMYSKSLQFNTFNLFEII